LQVETGELLPVQQHDLALGIADEAEDTEIMKVRYRRLPRLDAGDRLAGDIAPS